MEVFLALDAPVLGTFSIFICSCPTKLKKDCHFIMGGDQLMYSFLNSPESPLLTRYFMFSYKVYSIHHLPDFQKLNSRTVLFSSLLISGSLGFPP